VSFPVLDHSHTGRRQFIPGDSSGNDFSNYHVTQPTQDFDDLIMRQLSHLQLSHRITRQLPRRSERGSSPHHELGDGENDLFKDHHAEDGSRPRGLGR
jgi:hypothetical protein